MRWEIIDDNDMKQRSLLMRMYHSRQEGEAFYHSNFVHSEAETLQRWGWIEPFGDGWRMTPQGVSEWALMNAETFMHSEWHNRGEIFDELRQIIDEVNAMKSETCKVEGCDERRMMSKSGKFLTRCEKHQQDYWRDAKAKQAEEKKAEAEAAGIIPNKPGRPPKAKPARRQMDDTHELFKATVEALPDRPKLIDTYVAPETTNHWVDAPLPDGYAEICGDCVYKDVIELLEKRGVPGVKEIVEGVKALRK